MLAKPNRLRTSAEFDRVFSAGRTAHGKLLSVRVAESAEVTDAPAGFKVGFSIGKTVSLKAVVRNRIRRRLREIVRSLGQDNAFNAVELVVSAKRAAAAADSAQLREELERLLKKTEAVR